MPIIHWSLRACVLNCMRGLKGPEGSALSSSSQTSEQCLKLLAAAVVGHCKQSPAGSYEPSQSPSAAESMLVLWHRKRPWWWLQRSIAASAAWSDPPCPVTRCVHQGQCSGCQVHGGRTRQKQSLGCILTINSELQSFTWACAWR